MPQTLIYLTAEEQKQLESLRIKSNVKSKSDFIQKLIKEYLQKNGS